MDNNATRRILARLPALMAFLVPFFFAISGSDWQKGSHPDEATILSFMRTMAEDGEIDTGGILYPQGFFVLAEAYRKMSMPVGWISRWPEQEGRQFRDIDAIRAPIAKPDDPTIPLGRHLNAVLAGLCGLFLFLAAREATGSAAAGLCASALAACSPFLIEHAHYCETDIPYAAGLALSLWFLFSAIRRRSFRWAAAGAAAAAAAFACKYTAAPIVPFCVLVFAALCRDKIRAASTSGERRAAIRQCLLAMAACLASAVAAYALLTPTFRQDQSLFWSRIFSIYGVTHAETMTRDISTAMDAVPFLRARYVLRGIFTQFRQLGTTHAVLSAFAMVLLLVRRRRCNCGPWLVALAAMFLAFDVACAPWVRSQEFIPFAMILGAAIALAAGEIHAIAMSSRLAAVRLGVPALCVALCCALAYGGASRAAKMFTTEDCRNTARHWLDMTANPETPFAANRFASRALKSNHILTASEFGEAEAIWDPAAPDATNAPNHEYYIRQDVFMARGFASAITGKRHPHREAGWTNFLAHATPLREWRLTPGYQTTFAQLPVTLWGIIPENASLVTPAPLAPRPTAYRMGPEHYDAAQGGDWLGPIDAIRTVGARKGVRFVPPSDGRPLYAVTRHAEGVVPAKIKWEGCFEPREKVIDPRRADWFLYRPSHLDGWGDLCVRTRVRMRGDDQTSLCLTTITADPVFAAELLCRSGSPDKSAELLASAGLPADVGAATTQAFSPMPDKFLRDFARIRFGKFSVTPGPDTFTNEVADVTAPVTAELESEFPVLFDPGRYRVSFRIPRPEYGAPMVKSIFFTKATSQQVLAGEDFAPGAMVEMEVAFKKPACPHIRGVTVSDPKASPSVTLEDFTITWNPEFQ